MHRPAASGLTVQRVPAVGTVRSVHQASSAGFPGLDQPSCGNPPSHASSSRRSHTARCRCPGAPGSPDMPRCCPLWTPAAGRTSPRDTTPDRRTVPPRPANPSRAAFPSCRLSHLGLRSGRPPAEGCGATAWMIAVPVGGAFGLIGNSPRCGDLQPRPVCTPCARVNRQIVAVYGDQGSGGGQGRGLSLPGLPSC